MFIFSTISFFSSILSLFIGNMVYFQSSQKPVHRLFFILSLLNAYWGFSEFMIRHASNMNEAFLWLRIYPFAVVVIPVVLHFTILYTGRISFLQRKWELVALYIPVLVIATSQLFYNYMFASITTMPWGYTPVLASDSIPRDIAILWLVIINSSTIILILYHLIKTHDGNQKKQTFLVAIGVIAPIVLSNISQFSLPIFNVQIPELTTVGTALQTLFIGFAIWKYDLFAINPATAAHNIVSTMSDIFILLDPKGKIVSINQAMTDSLGYFEKDIIQMPISSILSGEVTEQFLFTKTKSDKKSKSTATIRKKSVKNMEGILITKSGKKISTSIAMSTLWNRNNSIAGYVAIARDITKQKQIQAERENLIKELQDALSNIKVLRGLLPICANCKKVRDDKGYWQDVTDYIREHTEADFTHGICPDCMEKLYPEFIDKHKNEDVK
jgi:PAS domain S-box-containing protein